MLLAFVAQRATPTNLALAAAAPAWVDARILTPEQARPSRHVRRGRAGPARCRRHARRRRGRALGARDARRAGRPRAQPRGGALAAHDKLLTARVLDGKECPTRARARSLRRPRRPTRGPFVVKPRFGSWGREVVAAASDEAAFGAISPRSSTRPGSSGTAPSSSSSSSRAGPTSGSSSPAASRVGAIRRSRRPGEWRTTSRSAARASASTRLRGARAGGVGGGRGRHRPGRRRPAPRRRRRLDRARAERRRRLHARVPDRPRPVRRRRLGARPGRPRRARVGAGWLTGADGQQVFTTSPRDLHLLSAHVRRRAVDTRADNVATNLTGERHQ